jgi:SHS2 domain-containing protein
VLVDQGEAHAVRASRHELVDHTSELTIRLRAPTFPALVEEATRAFGELVPQATLGEVDAEWRTFQVGGADPAASLVGWLNELVYLTEIEQWLPVDVEVHGDGRTPLRVRARGRALTRPFVLVKAATLHGAVVDPSGDGLEAEVTLDV